MHIRTHFGDHIIAVEVTNAVNLQDNRINKSHLVENGMDTYPLYISYEVIIVSGESKTAVALRYLSELGQSNISHRQLKNGNKILTVVSMKQSLGHSKSMSSLL